MLDFRLDGCSEEVQALQKQESSSAYRIHDYLGLGGPSGRVPQHHLCTPSLSRQTMTEWAMTSHSRWQVGQWFYKMITDFNFPRSFAIVAMSYFDRVISRSDGPPDTKDEVQLLALTCFYLAVKLHQAGPVLSTQQMSTISGDLYSPREISVMERHILSTLNWNLHPPTSELFARHFLSALIDHKLLPSEFGFAEVLEHTMNMLHGAVVDYFFVVHDLSPSHVAAAAVANAFASVLPGNGLLSSREFTLIIGKLVGIDLQADRIDTCRERLWSILPGTRPVQSMLATNPPSSPFGVRDFCPIPSSIGKSDMPNSSPVDVIRYGYTPTLPKSGIQQRIC